MWWSVSHVLLSYNQSVVAFFSVTNNFHWKILINTISRDSFALILTKLKFFILVVAGWKGLLWNERATKTIRIILFLWCHFFIPNEKGKENARLHQNMKVFLLCFQFLFIHYMMVSSLSLDVCISRLQWCFEFPACQFIKVQRGEIEVSERSDCLNVSARSITKTEMRE